MVAVRLDCCVIRENGVLHICLTAVFAVEVHIGVLVGLIVCIVHRNDQRVVISAAGVACHSALVPSSLFR